MPDLVSGLYVGAPDAGGAAGVPNTWPFLREELRLDVDGRYGLMVASGALSAGLITRVEWMANLGQRGDGKWGGAITYKHGDADRLPYIEVEIQAVAANGAERSLLVVFGGADGARQIRQYVASSAFLRRVDVQIDAVEGAEGVTS